MPQVKRSLLPGYINLNGALPSPSAVQEKRGRYHTPWTRTFLLPLPGLKTRRLRIIVPNLVPILPAGLIRITTRRGPFFVCLACFAVVLTVVMVSKGLGASDWSEQWPTGTSVDPSTLVFRKEDLQRIWNWEIASGHFPSHQSSMLLHFYCVFLGGLIGFSPQTNRAEEISRKSSKTT